MTYLSFVIYPYLNEGGLARLEEQRVDHVTRNYQERRQGHGPSKCVSGRWEGVVAVVRRNVEDETTYYNNLYMTKRRK